MSYAARPAGGWRASSMLVGAGLLAGAVFVPVAMQTSLRDWLLRTQIFSHQSPAEATGVKETAPDGASSAPLPAGASVVGFGIVDVDGGESRLAPPVPGIVAELAAKEGKRFEAGEILLKIRSVIAEQKLEQAREMVAQAETRLRQAKIAPQIYVQKIQEQGQAVTVAETMLEAQDHELKSLRALNEETLSPNRIYLETKKLRAAQAKVEAEQHRLKQIELEDPNEIVALADGDVKRARSALAEAAEFVDLHVLRAPELGTVLRVFAAKGQWLAANPMQPVILFRPDRKAMLRCEVNQEFADRLVVGQRAEIYADRLQGPRWHGVVSRCSDWIGPRRSQLDEPLERNDVRTLECIIDFDANQPPLRQGQRMRVVFIPKN